MLDHAANSNSAGFIQIKKFIQIRKSTEGNCPFTVMKQGGSEASGIGGLASLFTHLKKIDGSAVCVLSFVISMVVCPGVTGLLFT